MLTPTALRLQRIIEQTHDRLLAVLLPLCKSRTQCDDIMQETYIRLWQNLEQVKDDEAVLALLKKYARNIFLDELRRMARQHVALARIDTYGEPYPSGEELFIEKEYSKEIQTAISKLPRQQQLIFRLHKEQAQSYKQIAEQLGITTGTIEKQMGRALKFLRHELGPLYYADRALMLVALYYGCGAA